MGRIEVSADEVNGIGVVLVEDACERSKVHYILKSYIPLSFPGRD